MTLGTVLVWIDTGVLLAIMWCAIEGSRLVNWHLEPLRALAFGVVAVSSLGFLLTYRECSLDEVGWGIAQHAGFLLYAVLHLIKRRQEGSHERVTRQHLRGSI